MEHAACAVTSRQRRWRIAGQAGALGLGQLRPNEELAAGIDDCDDDTVNLSLGGSVNRGCNPLSPILPSLRLFPFQTPSRIVSVSSSWSPPPLPRPSFRLPLPHSFPLSVSVSVPIPIPMSFPPFVSPSRSLRPSLRLRLSASPPPSFCLSLTVTACYWGASTHVVITNNV